MPHENFLLKQTKNTPPLNIFEQISALDVQLRYTNNLPPHWLGCYLDDSRLILIRNGLTVAEEAETLHHEYVHAFYRDRKSERFTEDRADRTAARMLISPHDYARAERINPNLIAIARELGRTPQMVQTYRTACLPLATNVALKYGDFDNG